MKKYLFLLWSTFCFCAYSFNSSALTVTLTSSNHNGYSVSCFGGRDGAITLSASGGTSPYTYNWSTGATTQNISGLPSRPSRVSRPSRGLCGIGNATTNTIRLKPIQQTKIHNRVFDL